jgi:hypothetical protein
LNRTQNRLGSQPIIASIAKYVACCIRTNTLYSKAILYLLAEVFFDPNQILFAQRELSTRVSADYSARTIAYAAGSRRRKYGQFQLSLRTRLTRRRSGMMYPTDQNAAPPAPVCTDC